MEAGQTAHTTATEIKENLLLFLVVYLFATRIAWVCLPVKGKDPGKDQLKTESLIDRAMLWSQRWVPPEAWNAHKLNAPRSTVNTH